MEMFRKLFDLQFKFLEYLARKAGNEIRVVKSDPPVKRLPMQDMNFKEKGQVTKEFTTAIMCELGELLDEVDWKSWQKSTNSNSHTMTNIKEELVDILHFWLDLCILWNFDADEMFKAYMEKNKENIRRQEYGY